MIFSNQELHRAFAYKSVYYTKVIFVNRDDGSFLPIKVDDNEWKNLNKTYNYERWHEEFSKSLYFKEVESAHMFYWFASFEMLKTLNTPASMTYTRLVGDEWHKVTMEAVPTADGIYIFVKDLNKVERGELNDDGIQEQR